MTREEAEALHRSSIVIDAHCDTVLVPFGKRRDLVTRSDSGDVDVPRLIEGGVSGQFMAMLASDEHRGAVRALEGIDTFYTACARSPELTLATTASDILKAKAESTVAAVLALESSDALEGELATLRMLYRLGVRSISLTHNYRNRAADGVFEVPGGGLSQFGRQVVREVNRLGMILDIAHLAPPGISEVLELAEAPLISSHSATHALWANPRNLSDAHLDAIARNGGVACITYVDRFLTDARPTVDHVVNHIEHAVAVAGVDHVGLGSDFDGFVGPRPQGLANVTELPNLTASLAERGYAAEAIAKILGGNLLRVIEQVCG